jgi:Excinuclease ABC subunit C
MSDLHSEELLAQVAALPALPGVYRYFDAQDALLYVGKALNLKRRVSSYFQKNHGGTRIGHMVGKIVRMETTVVRSEAEALLLENNLIKTLNPKFNILFRDDKSYPYLKITGTASATGDAPGQVFPRMAYYRGAVDKKHRYFGPYPSAWAVKEPSSCCKRCSGCAPARTRFLPTARGPACCTRSSAARGPAFSSSRPRPMRPMMHAEALLRGETQELLQALEARMMAHSDKLEFEQAAELRNQMQALSRVLHQQAIETADDKDVDILAVRVQGGRACVNLAMVRGGRHLGDRPYFPVHVEDAAGVFAQESDEETPPDAQPLRPVEALVLEAFIGQHYIGVPCAAAAGHQRAGGQGPVGSADRAKRPARERHPPATRTAPRMARYGAKERRPAAGPSAGRRGLAAGAHPALAEALDLPPEDLDQLTIECLTSRTRRANPRRHRAWCFTTTRCRAVNTAVTRSKASPAAMTTPPCARCSRAATARWPKPRAKPVASTLRPIPRQGGKRPPGPKAWRACPIWC